MPRRTVVPAVEAQPLSQVRLAQGIWAQASVRARLAFLRRARRQIATNAVAFAQSVPNQRPGSLRRNAADTLVAEVLPLLEACRFLEREAAFVLAPRRVSTHGRPYWLRGVSVETRREPLGVVLIIGPANYPLFLPGVQALQALAAGNAVLWKPAPGGRDAAEALRSALVGQGLDPALLQVLDESPQAATDAMQAGVDKVFLTGSAATGEAVLSQLALSITPSVMELSGCDAVFVLPGADHKRVIEALLFGLRLNGSATCMAPRRLFLVDDHVGLVETLLESLKRLPPVALPQSTRELLHDLLEDAIAMGGAVQSSADEGLRFAVVLHAKPQMRIVNTDVFAPVLSIFQTPGVEDALRAHAACPYALTAAVFGPEGEARRVAARLPVNTVLINDVIVATADPRVSFGGRRRSGFGSTRGREGLLEMTALKTIVVQKSGDLRPYRPTEAKHEPFFAAYLQLVHGCSWQARWHGLRSMIRAARRL